MIGETEGIKIYVNDETYTKYKKTLEDEIDELQKENKQLKNNWNKLKKYINEANEDLYWTNNYDDILYVMQELEGSDSNE